VDAYDDLPRNAANYAQLTPLSFLPRAAELYPQRLAVIHGQRTYTWAEFQQRVLRAATALTRLGIGRNDTVSVMLSNTPEMLELHFAVPLVGAVLHTLNTRLDSAAIAFQLRHAESRLFIGDREFGVIAERAVTACAFAGPVIVVNDSEFAGPATRLTGRDYEDWLAESGDIDPARDFAHPHDEWDAIALSYTSGTTGDPKGVVTHHRGAYLNAIGNIVTWTLPQHPVYLWTLPMFHCNGWCFPWTLAAVGGTHVCLRKVEATAILQQIATHQVTHYCGAPIVHSLIAQADPALHANIRHRVFGMVAGAAPPAAMIEAMDGIGFDLTHVYGLTELYGPASVCVRQAGWTDLPVSERAQLNSRQGVRYVVQEGMQVMDPMTLTPVPRDGETMGEIFFRGNIVMKGYLKNPAANAAAFAGGWFHSGDLAVQYPDGYAKIKDRSKDIIISGGENISSLEVEDALYRHPAVLSCAVVARPDPRWGETPVAFIERKPGTSLTAEDLLAHCRAHLAAYKCPRDFRFEPIPKTATGKIQKFELRLQVAKGGDTTEDKEEKR
jgi:fatty-acyl-CoA synthase